MKATKSPASVVYLQDQFDAGPAGTTAGTFETVSAGQPEFFCNPTEKIQAGAVTNINNPDDHLTCYQIKDIGDGNFQPRSVVVQNQFGAQNLDVVRPADLCAPTQKLLVDDKQPPIGGNLPDDLDHFKCYDVKGPQIKEPVSLQDEFDILQSPNHLEDVRVGQAVLLCNPARKVHFVGFADNTLTRSAINIGVFPVLHPEAHLVCYRITPPEQQGHRLLIWNQFGTQLLGSVRSELLCVPSLKFETPPTATPTPTATACPAGTNICTPTPTATPCLAAANVCTPTPTVTATPCVSTSGGVCTPTATPCVSTSGGVCTPTPTQCPATANCTPTPTPCTPPACPGGVIAAQKRANGTG